MSGKQRNGWLVMAWLAVMLVAGPALAQTITTEQRAEFNRLVQERNQLHEQLARLDRKSADLMKQGKDPVTVHAEQVGVEDRLDMVELRMEMLAARFGLEIPPLPSQQTDEAAQGAGATDPQIERAFSRGRNRSLEQLRQETQLFLASLDFEAFLNE